MNTQPVNPEDIKVGSIWKEIDEVEPQTYLVIAIIRSKSGNVIDHWEIDNVIDNATCRVGITFFEYAREQK